MVHDICNVCGIAFTTTDSEERICPLCAAETDNSRAVGFKTRDYVSMTDRFFCACHGFATLHPCELETQDSSCPECGSIHSEFTKVGL